MKFFLTHTRDNIYFFTCYLCVYDSIPLVCFIYILKWYLITMFFFLVGYLQKTCPVLLDYVELYPVGLWNHTLPVKEWLLRWIHYVEFLERAPGYRMEEAAGWITSHSHSLHNVSISYLLFLLCFTEPTENYHLMPAFSDIYKICKLSVSARSVYSSVGISFCVIGFLKHFSNNISKTFYTAYSGDFKKTAIEKLACTC